MRFFIKLRLILVMMLAPHAFIVGMDKDEQTAVEVAIKEIALVALRKGVDFPNKHIDIVEYAGRSPIFEDNFHASETFFNEDDWNTYNPGGYKRVVDSGISIKRKFIVEALKPSLGGKDVTFVYMAARLDQLRKQNLLSYIRKHSPSKLAFTGYAALGLCGFIGLGVSLYEASKGKELVRSSLTALSLFVSFASATFGSYKAVQSFFDLMWWNKCENFHALIKNLKA